MLFRLLLRFLFFLSPAVAFAQPQPTYHVQRYETEDGLPSNGIKGLQWDNQTGFLWIATEAGIVRFGGMSFKTYTVDDNPHITNERILFVIRNNAGSIFTADNSGNIFSIKKNYLLFEGKKIIGGNSFSNMLTLGVSDILYRADQHFTNGPFTALFDKVMPDSDTSTYIQHSGRTYYLSVSMATPKQLALPGGAIALFKCRNEMFYIDSNGQSWHINKIDHSFSKVDLSFGEAGANFDTRKNSFLWENGMEKPVVISGDHGWALSWENGKLIAHLIATQIPEDAPIRYAQYDESTKTLFLGTDSKGIIIIRQNRVEPMRNERVDPKQRTSYYSQVELPDGTIMTNEGHIIGSSNQTQPAVPFQRIFSNNTLLAGDSVFWFFQVETKLNGSCLHSYNFKTKKLTSYEKIREKYSQTVMTISGVDLYAANELGIYKMTGDSLESVFHYPIANSLATNFDMKEIEPGVLAIADCKSLLRYNIAAKKLDTLYSSANYCARTIWVYKDYVFFGTYGDGLFVCKKGVVKPLPLDKNRYLLFTHCFINDNNGYCWISTNRGLFKASIADMIDAYETGATQVYYHYFGRNDGMEMTEMNGGCTPCAIMMRNQTISFPTMEGLLWVNPKIAQPDLPTGEIYIDHFIVDGKQINPDSISQKTLPQKTSEISIELGLSAWCNKENIYIDYRLSGDPNWKPVRIEKAVIITLNNLPQGRYKLEMRKRNGFGKDNYSYKTLEFTIATPWYKKWWFYLLVALAVFGILALYLRFRTRQYVIQQRKLERQVAEKTKELLQKNEVLEKNDTIKTRLISIISHDIVTPLKFLTVAGKNLLEKKQMMSEDLQKETIGEMTNTSQELQLLSTNILNWIKYQNENRRQAKETFNIHELIEQVLGLLKSLARQKHLTLLNDTDQALAIHQYAEPLKILIYNLISNAINFTEKGSIVISSRQESDAVVLSVKDEGVGMTPEQIHNIMADQFIISSTNIDKRKGNGLGYLIIKDLIKMMGAEMKIQSEKDRGTNVSIYIPNGKR